MVRESRILLLPAVASQPGDLRAGAGGDLLRVGRRIFLRRRPKPMPQPGTIWLTFGARTAAICGRSTWQPGDILPGEGA